MSIGETLAEQLKAAMRERNQDRVGCIRQVRSKIQEAVNAADFKGEVDDELHIKIISSYVKSLQKANEELAAAGERSQALRDKYQAEIDYLSVFLPKKLDEAATRELVVQAIEKVGAASPKDLGKVIGTVMKVHRDKVDPALVRSLSETELNKE